MKTEDVVERGTLVILSCNILKILLHKVVGWRSENCTNLDIKVYERNNVLF